MSYHLRMIPLSKSEAWRLYSQGQCIIEYSDKHPYGLILAPGHPFNDFHGLGKHWRVRLSEEDSPLFVENEQGRYYNLITAVVGICLGFLFFFLYLANIPTPRFSELELLIYSQSLLFLACYGFVKFSESMKKEKDLWNKMYEKYDVFDWKNTFDP